LIRLVELDNILLTALWLLLLAGLPLAAQTAHYLGQQTIVDPIVLSPRGVAVDSYGTVYVPDSSNGWVRVETPPSTGSGAYTWFKIGAGQVGGAGPLAVDGAGNIYVTSVNAYSISTLTKLAPTNTGQYAATTPLSGGGYAGVVVDGNGILYVSNQGGGNNSLLKLTPSGSGYTQSSLGPGWFEPQGVAVDNIGNVYVAVTNGGSSDVYRVSASCTAGPNCSETQIGSGLQAPLGVAVDAGLNVYVADNLRTSVVKIPLQSGGYGAQVLLGYELKGPSGVAVDPFGNIYVADTNNNRVVKIQIGPVYFGSWTVNTTSTPPQSMTFVFDTAGKLGDTFVETTGTTSPFPKGKDFSNTGGGSCKAGHTYNAGDTCTVHATCTPLTNATYSGVAGLKNSSGHEIAKASLVCTGLPVEASSTGGGPLSCTTYDACGDVVSYSPTTISQWGEPVGIVSEQNAMNSGDPECKWGAAMPPAQTICTPEVITLGGGGHYKDKPTPEVVNKKSTPASVALDQSLQAAKVSDITSTSATVSWKTNTPTQNGVLYQAEGGTIRPVPNVASTSEPSFRLEHLKPGTLYHLTVWSYTDTDVASAMLTFTTKAQ
jgi:streptogramin lyase